MAENGPIRIAFKEECQLRVGVRKCWMINVMHISADRVTE